jgi:hypothetical protein
VVNDNYDDRERAKKIEARLAFAISKARINSEPDWHLCFARLNQPNAH